MNNLSSFPFKYYKDIAFVKIDTNNIFWGQDVLFWNGEKWTADTIKYANQLNSLRGRTWFLFTSVGDEKVKCKFLLDYCKYKKNNLIKEFHTHGSDVYLFDFIDRE